MRNLLLVCEGEHMFDLIDSNNECHFSVASFLDLV